MNSPHTFQLRALSSSIAVIVFFLIATSAHAASVPSACDTKGIEQFTGCYFNNIGMTGEPALVRTEKTINFEWGTMAPDPAVHEDFFSARWVGDFAFEGGAYTFTVKADDGVRVYIDNIRVLNKWADQPATTFSFDRTLTAGAHTVRVEYYEAAGAATVTVGWARAQAAALVPAQYMSASVGSATLLYSSTSSPLMDPVALRQKIQMLRDEITHLQFIYNQIKALEDGPAHQ